jgi:hypothetical protein
MVRFAATAHAFARLLTGLLLLAMLGTSFSADTPPGNSRVPHPVIETARGGQCVEEPAFMRRNHMKMLKHQRDDTLRGGNRTGQHSLKGCIDCHASKSTNSVADSGANFCQSCHSYAAVKIDCFECHNSKTQVKP